MHLKFLDEDWLNEQIKGMQELQHKPYFDTADEDVLKVLINIKEQLIFPKEEVKIYLNGDYTIKRLIEIIKEKSINEN